jgi:hypothetical protein
MSAIVVKRGKEIRLLANNKSRTYERRGKLVVLKVVPHFRRGIHPPSLSQYCVA